MNFYKVEEDQVAQHGGGDIVDNKDNIGEEANDDNGRNNEDNDYDSDNDSLFSHFNSEGELDNNILADGDGEEQVAQRGGDDNYGGNIDDNDDESYGDSKDRITAGTEVAQRGGDDNGDHEDDNYGGNNDNNDDKSAGEPEDSFTAGVGEPFALRGVARS